MTRGAGESDADEKCPLAEQITGKTPAKEKPGEAISGNRQGSPQDPGNVFEISGFVESRSAREHNGELEDQ